MFWLGDKKLVFLCTPVYIELFLVGFFMFYRGSPGRLANFVKSATLLKKCINKLKQNKTKTGF